MSLFIAVFLAAAGTLDVAGRAEVRVRGGSDVPQPVAEAEIAPSAILRYQAHAYRLSLTYAPRFTIRQIETGAAFEPLNGGSLEVGWRGRRAAVSATGDATYGTASFTSIALQTPAPEGGTLQRFPQGGSVAYASARASVAVTYQATRRLALQITGEGAASGGADAPSRVRIPFQVGPRLTLGADVAATRSDRATTSINASYETFSSGAEAGVATVSEAWRRAWTRRTDTSIGAGVAGSWSHPAGTALSRLALYPTAEATVASRLPAERLDVRLSLGIAPVIDRLTGQVDERLQGAAGVAWGFHPRAGVRAQMAAAQSVPQTAIGAVTLVSGEAAIWLAVGRSLRIEVGTRGALQGGQAGPQWISFATATTTTQPLRF